MAPILRPLFTWGRALTECIPYSFLSGTSADMTLTMGRPDPFGGTTALRIDKTSAVQVPGPYWFVNNHPGENLEVWWCAKYVSGTGRSGFRLFEVLGANATVLYQTWTWTAGVPSNVISGGGNAFVSLGFISLGNGWYLFGARSTIPPTESSQLRCVMYAAVNNADLQAVDFWCGNVVVAPYPVDAMVSSPEMDEGAAMEMMPNGEHQSWVNEWQYDVTMDVRYVPINGQGPANVGPGSGWDGQDFGAPGINVGFSSLQQALEDGEVVKFCPSLFDTSVIYSVTGAVEGGTQLADRDDALTRRFSLRLSTLTPVPGL